MLSTTTKKAKTNAPGLVNLEAVQQCEGCGHLVLRDEKKFCKAYPDPAAKWMFGSCNFATHVQRKIGVETKKVNPLKASKKAAAGR